MHKDTIIASVFVKYYKKTERIFFLRYKPFKKLKKYGIM